MNLQKQLRRLEILAGDRDRAGVLDALTELGRHSGWSRDVEDAITHMGAKQRTFVQHVIDSQQPAFADVPGPGDQAGGNVSHGVYWSTTTMAGVAQDATSGIYVPANASEWTQTMAAAGIGSGGPLALYLCQEVAGNLADTISGITLAVTGTPTYGAVIGGWSRKGIVLADATSQQFASTSASLPDISTTSALLLIYMAVNAAPAAGRILAALGTTAARLKIDTTPHAQAASVANTATGAVVLGTGIIPMLLEVDVTHTAVTGDTDAEELIPTFSAMTGKKLVIGTDGVGSAAAQTITYAALFSGANAELIKNSRRSLLQTLGWAPLW